MILGMARSEVFGDGARGRGVRDADITQTEMGKSEFVLMSEEDLYAELRGVDVDYASTQTSGHIHATTTAANLATFPPPMKPPSAPPFPQQSLKLAKHSAKWHKPRPGERPTEDPSNLLDLAYCENPPSSETNGDIGFFWRDGENGKPRAIGSYPCRLRAGVTFEEWRGLDGRSVGNEPGKPGVLRRGSAYAPAPATTSSVSLSQTIAILGGIRVSLTSHSSPIPLHSLTASDWFTLHEKYANDQQIQALISAFATTLSPSLSPSQRESARTKHFLTSLSKVYIPVGVGRVRFDDWGEDAMRVLGTLSGGVEGAERELLGAVARGLREIGKEVVVCERLGKEGMVDRLEDKAREGRGDFKCWGRLFG